MELNKIHEKISKKIDPYADLGESIAEQVGETPGFTRREAEEFLIEGKDESDLDQILKEEEDIQKRLN